MSLTTMLRFTASSSLLLRHLPARPAALSSRLRFLSSASTPRSPRSLRAAAKRSADEDSGEGDSAMKLRQGRIVPAKLQTVRDVGAHRPRASGRSGRAQVRPLTHSKYSMLMPLAENELLACTAIRCKLLPVCNHFRSMMTWVSVDEREVKALELFLSTVKDGTIPADEICRLYLESLSRSSNLATAVYLLSYLHDREIHVPLNTYNILLASVSEASDFQLFSEVFKNLLLSYQPPDFSSYVNVARAIQKVADSDQLLKFIMEVSEMTVHRDPTVMNRIIFVTAKSGQIDKSIMIFEELKNLGRKMDKVTFNTVLAMLGKAGRVDQMLSEFTLMKDLGYTPDIVTYNTLINCLRRFGRLELCKAFTTEMLERGMQMNLRTYTALIDAFGRAGHVKEALRLFDELKSSQRPSVYVYRALISNLKKAGKFDLALKLSEEMNTNASNLTGPSDFKQKKRKRK